MYHAITYTLTAPGGVPTAGPDAVPHITDLPRGTGTPPERRTCSRLLTATRHAAGKSQESATSVRDTRVKRPTADSDLGRVLCADARRDFRESPRMSLFASSPLIELKNNS